MFIGSINRYMRAVLETAALRPGSGQAGAWKGLPVYVACSGNFTVERILARCGVGAIHSNDVSIYSCALGWHLANTPKRYAIKAQEYSWLEPYLDPGPATIATLLLTGEMLKVSGDNAYAKRMRDEYRRRWPVLHAKTVERVTKATASLPIASYFAGDCREFLARADKNAVCISFPPTYKGGYERLFKKLDAIFDWPAPSYQLFAPEDFDLFSQTVRSFRHWMISSDAPQPALAHQHVATVQTSLLSKPVYMYCDAAPTRLATASQTLARNPWCPTTSPPAIPRATTTPRGVWTTRPYYKSIRVEQAHLEAVVLDHIFDAWMAEAVKVHPELAGPDAWPHQWFWDGHEHVDPQKEASAQAQRRFAICKACDEFNGNVCEKRFPDGICHCTWNSWVQSGQCPAGLW